MTFSQRLTDTRTDKDMTQEELATSIGITRRQYIRYEKGQSEVTQENLKMICLTLQVSADYLLGLPKGLQWPR